MKKIVSLAIVLLALNTGVFAQNCNADKAQKKEIREAIKEKASKEAKKSAKQMEKEGWKPFPGTETLEKQMHNSMLAKYERYNGMPAYIIGQGTATAANLDAARNVARKRAIANIAENLGTAIASITEASDSNIELTDGEVETINKTMTSSQQFFQREIGQTNDIVQIYRNKDGNKVEVMITKSYDGKRAQQAVLKAFEKESAELRAKLEKKMKGE
ncbi:MAG: hypothetical protein J5630_05450 [Bacteroidaceae bacterium]|nr:hypothetical protein [Bacteroidaceae bacterium]